jgi:putative thioredoxin
MAVDAPNVIEVTDATFGTAVLEESHRRPVVVDFWAGWCQPCRLIGPVLERLALEHGGQFLLAKLDVDANPQIASSFRIQSIPAVKAFHAGRLVSEFIGAIPEDQIRAFLRWVVPSEGDRVVMKAEEAERAGRVEEAERLYRQVFQEDPSHREAALGLGRLAGLRGDVEEARRLLSPLRPDREAERLLAAIDVSQWSEGGRGDGEVARAERAAAEGRFDEALHALLEQVRAGGQDRDRAREAMLKVFAVLGDQDLLTQEYRRKLARALY